MNDDLKTLVNMKDALDSKVVAQRAEEARISNPAKEIESSLTDFITSRLSRLEQDAQFGDLVKMHLRQRFPEFTVDQLLTLNDQISKNNNKAVEGMMTLFQGDQSGKTVMDHMDTSSTATTAQTLYDKADKDMLQALGYLSSVLSKAALGNVVPGEVVEHNKN